MLGKLFNKDDDEKRQMSEGMQSMSDQIGALSKQLAEKNAEIERLQTAAKGATSDTAALQTARQQVDDLQKQLRDLQRKMAEDQATREAEAMADDLIRKQKAESQAKEVAAAPAAGGLAVGGTAYVTRAGGMPLRLRSGAGLNHDAVDRLPPGTQMTLLEGPRQADNHAWWHIRTSDGREGWVAGEELRTQPD
jgi:Bacterial SH3 domain